MKNYKKLFLPFVVLVCVLFHTTPLHAGGGYSIRSCFNFSEGLAPVLKEGKWGYIDHSGTIIIPPKFQEPCAAQFSEGLAAVRDGRKIGYINRKGEWHIEPQFGVCVVKTITVWGSSFHHGIARVLIDGKWSYIYKSGEKVFEKSFQRSFSVSSIGPGRRYESPSQPGVFGFRRWVSPKPPGAFGFTEGLARVCIDDGKKRGLGFIDTQGTIVIKPRYYSGKGPMRGPGIGPFSEGLAKVMYVTDKEFNPKGPDKWGYIDRFGKFVIKQQYAQATEFSEGSAAVAIGKKKKDGEVYHRWGYIDRKGKWIIEPRYNWARKFSEGLAAVRIGSYQQGKLGYLDTTGKMVIDMAYKHACDFSEGLAAVKSNGKWGYINKQGEWVIRPQFDGANEFAEGLAGVCLDDKWGYINKQGGFIWKPTK